MEIRSVTSFITKRCLQLPCAHAGTVRDMEATALSLQLISWHPPASLKIILMRLNLYRMKVTSLTPTFWWVYIGVCWSHYHQRVRDALHLRKLPSAANTGTSWLLGILRTLAPPLKLKGAVCHTHILLQNQFWLHGPQNISYFYFLVLEPLFYP